MKIFTIGRPGSGKSTAARRIIEHARRHNWDTMYIKDYDILYDMYKKDVTQQKFRKAEYGGFDVTDFSVLDEALTEVQRKAREHTPPPDQSERSVIVIEFARDDYSVALNLFDSDVLDETYILFVDTGIENCIRRIYVRAASAQEHGQERDNHFVSESILRSYYLVQEKPGPSGKIEGNRITVIENDDSQEQFLNKVDQFVEEVLSLKVHAPV